MHVGDLMTRHVVTISMDATLADAKASFERHGFHHLVVVEAGRVVGVLSDSDVWQHISPFVGKMAERPVDLSSLQRRVHQVMTRTPSLAHESWSVKRAGIEMTGRRIGCLPVVDGLGKCVGIVTIRDLAILAVQLLQQLDHQAEEASEADGAAGRANTEAA